MKPRKKAKIRDGAGLTDRQTTAKRDLAPTGKKNVVSKLDESIVV